MQENGDKSSKTKQSKSTAEEKPFNAVIEMLRKKFPDASMEALTAADRLLREQALPGERQKAIEAVAKALGLKVEWRDTMEKENGTFNPKTRTITIARDSEHALANTFGHEVTHAVRNLSEADYKNLKDAVRRLYSSEKEYNEAVQAYGDEYTGLDFNALEEELIADNIGFMIGGRNDMTQELASRMNHRVLWAIHDAMNKVRNALAKVLHIDSKKNGFLEALDSARATIRETMANAQRIAKEKGQGLSNESDSTKQSLRTQDSAIRDAFVERMRLSGMDVITDETGQRVLDLANGKVRLMGSRTNKKMKEIADVLSEHELSEQQKTVVDVYSGKTDNLQLEVSRNDGNRRIVIRQGNDNKAGTKHSVYRHYGTTEGVITAEDILLIPEVLNRGERKSIKRGNTQLYEYVLRNVNGAEYTVLTEINNRGKETFADFYSNKKVSSTARKTRSSEAQARLDETLSVAKIEEISKTANKSGEKLREQRVYHGSGAEFDHFDHIRFFRTANGEAYGFTVGGKIYIDPRIATSETPVHEYAHLWATALKSANAKEWLNVVGLMKGTKVWDEVKALYPELKSDDEIADEVLATYSGRRGAERLREEQRRIAKGNGSVFEKAEAISALESVKQALKRFWKGVADFLHIHYTSAEEVADRVMKDLLDGVDPRTFGDVEKGIRFQTSEELNNRFGGRWLDEQTRFSLSDDEELSGNDDEFNRELDAFRDKSHKGLLHLGRPLGILRACGIRVDEMTISPSVLYSHLKKHGLTTDDLKGLARSVQSPILVYRHGKRSPNIVAVTELDVNGGKLSASFELDDEGHVVEVSNISSIHSKEAKRELERLYKMGEGDFRNALRWVEKEKVLAWLAPSSYEPSDMQSGKAPFDIANVLINFENPKISDENVADEGIMFRNGGAADAEKQSRRGTPNLYPDHIAQAIYEQSVSGFKFDLDEAWHDSLLSVKRLQEAISETRGVPIRDFENAYWHAVALSSVNAAEMEQLMNLRIQPFIEAVQDICKKHDLTQEDIEVYLNCKHGLERNEAMARRDAEKQANEEFKDELRKAERAAAKDPLDQDAADALDDVKQRMNDREEELYLENREKDYSGLTDIFDPKDKVTGDRLYLTVAELEDEAKKYVKRFEAEVGVADVTKLWDNIHELNNYSLRKSYLCGLISKSLYDSVKQMYQWYVPLRGFNEEVAGDVYTYVTRGETRTQQHPKRKHPPLAKTRVNPLPNRRRIMPQSNLPRRTCRVTRTAISYTTRYQWPPPSKTCMTVLWMMRRSATSCSLR